MTNQPLASPDRTSSVAFFDLAGDPQTPIATSQSIFVWAIEGERGDYVSNVRFERPGSYAALFTTQAPGKPAETIRFEFDVRDKASAVGVGQKAPSVDTPTAADVGGDLAKISTDPKPDPRFYETSEADALSARKPFVLVFATPAFCQSRQCGPTLDRVKQIAAKYPKLTFINVEPYKLEFVDGRLQPLLDANNGLQAVPAVDAFGIQVEPWVYVVDASGVVRGSFETIFSDAEIKAAIDAAQKA